MLNIFLVMTDCVVLITLSGWVICVGEQCKISNVSFWLS